MIELKAGIISHVLNIRPETLIARIDHTVLSLEHLIGTDLTYRTYIVRIFLIIITSLNIFLNMKYNNLN